MYAWPKFHGSSPYSFWENDLNTKKFTPPPQPPPTPKKTTTPPEKQYICHTSASQVRQKKKKKKKKKQVSAYNKKFYTYFEQISWYLCTLSSWTIQIYGPNNRRKKVIGEDCVAAVNYSVNMPRCYNVYPTLSKCHGHLDNVGYTLYESACSLGSCH